MEPLEDNKDLRFAIRSASSVDFLSSKEERILYRNAIYNAIVYAKLHLK